MSAIVTTVADKTGDAATHAMAASATPARWVTVSNPSTNASPIRVGDSSTAVGRGVCIDKGLSYTFPVLPYDVNQSAPQQALYDLSTLYYFAANSDKVCIAWGN